MGALVIAIELLEPTRIGSQLMNILSSGSGGDKPRGDRLHTVTYELITISIGRK